MANELDALYTTPPAAFVQTRNALAKTLKAAGRREEAARVAALSRPSPAVWAVNQIARRAPALVARLGELTEQLQRAPGGASYGELVNAHRDLLRTLRDQGAEILEAAGLRGSPEVLATVVQNLRAGMADRAARPLVEGGRLERDVESEVLASGFAPPPAAPPPRLVSVPMPPPPPAPDKGAADRERTHAESAARAEAEMQREEAEKQRAEAQAKRAEAQAKRAEAEAKIDRLRAALAEAEDRQSAEEAARAKAAAALGEADRRLVTAREAAGRAAQELARAEIALSALPR